MRITTGTCDKRDKHKWHGKPVAICNCFTLPGSVSKLTAQIVARATEIGAVTTHPSGIPEYVVRLGTKDQPTLFCTADRLRHLVRLALLAKSEGKDVLLGIGTGGPNRHVRTTLRGQLHLFGTSLENVELAGGLVMAKNGGVRMKLNPPLLKMAKVERVALY